jgi:hypothetical protein
MVMLNPDLPIVTD